MVLNAAVIGIGNMGKNHARIYSELKESALVGVSDVDAEKGRMYAEKHECNYYSSYKDMLKNESIDVVSVCVPTHMHYAVSRDVIKSGVNLLVEKPIAGDIRDAEKIVRLAESKGIKLTVGHVERFNPAVNSLKKIIKQGKLGKITSLLARRVGLFPPQIKQSDVIIDLAVHDIDVFNYILEKQPTEVYIRGGKSIVNKRDYAGLFLTYNNINGIIEVNWITPTKIRVLNVTGTLGYASLNYITQELFLYRNNYEKTYDKFGDFVFKFGRPRKTSVKVKKAEPLKLEILDFLKCIEEGKEPLVSGQDGINVLKIALGRQIK